LIDVTHVHAGFDIGTQQFTLLAVQRTNAEIIAVELRLKSSNLLQAFGRIDQKLAAGTALEVLIGHLWRQCICKGYFGLELASKRCARAGIDVLPQLPQRVRTYLAKKGQPPIPRRPKPCPRVESQWDAGQDCRKGKSAYARRIQCGCTLSMYD
jgi:hypothetical protein